MTEYYNPETVRKAAAWFRSEGIDPLVISVDPFPDKDGYTTFSYKSGAHGRTELNAKDKSLVKWKKGQWASFREAVWPPQHTNLPPAQGPEN